MDWTATSTGSTTTVVSWDGWMITHSIGESHVDITSEDGRAYTTGKVPPWDLDPPPVEELSSFLEQFRVERYGVGAAMDWTATRTGDTTTVRYAGLTITHTKGKNVVRIHDATGQGITTRHGIEELQSVEDLLLMLKDHLGREAHSARARHRFSQQPERDDFGQLQ